MFESKLKEDQAVYIRSPTIAPNKYTFKISDVTSKLNLHGRTTVNECLHFQSKTTYGFSFVSFETIISSTATSNESIDIIGEVVSLGKLDSRDVSKSLHRLPLQIRNLEGLQVNVTLFGDIAYQLISYLEAHKEVGRVIVLLQFARINVYNATPSINSYYEQTRMFINANLPEIVTFTDSLVGLRGLQNPSASLTVESSKSYSESDDFLNNYKVKNVVDLIEPQVVGQYIIVGTIYGICQDIDWYYDACTNCGKKVETKDVFSGPDSGDASVVLKCNGDNCKNKKISSVPRYKIPIRVQDDSGTITLTLFDRDAYRLVKKRARDLIDKIKLAGDNPRLYPYDLKCLEHKKMAFKIDVNSFNVSNNYNRFGILGYTVDSNVIDALEKKLAVEAGSPANADDTEIASHEVSQETKSLKDAISQTGDNLTPTLPGKFEATSPFKYNSPTIVKKRNVGDTIDVDDYDNVNSSTKVPQLNSKVDANTGLLIPKLENIALCGVHCSNIDTSCFIFAGSSITFSILSFTVMQLLNRISIPKLPLLLPVLPKKSMDSASLFLPFLPKLPLMSQQKLRKNTTCYKKTFQNNNNNMSPFTTPTKTTLFGLEDENTNRTPKTNLIPILPSTPYTTGSIAMQTAVTPAPVLIKEIVPEEVIEYSFEERRAGFVIRNLLHRVPAIKHHRHFNNQASSTHCVPAIKNHSSIGNFNPFIATTNMDSFKTNKKIKLNNFYLDNTKQLHSYTTSVSQIPTSTNVTNPGDNASNRNIYHVQATEKRRIRKLYLDNKKKAKFKGVVHPNKNLSASTSSVNVSKKSNFQTCLSRLNVRTPLSNISNVMDISDNSFQSRLPNIRLNSNGVVDRNKSVSTSTSSANMSKETMLRTPPSHLNVRSPLSNISNVIDIPNNSFQTPLPNMKLDSNGVVHRNKSTYRSKTSSNTSKQAMLQPPTSHVNVRTPLSNIFNAMDISNNSCHSPLTNIRQFSVFSNGDISNKSSTITSKSSSVLLPNPNNKAKKKRPNLTPIPIFGLRSDQDKIDGQNEQNIYNGISKDYLDHGDQIVVCQTCFAKLWKDESIKCKKNENQNYSLCCGYDKVELPTLKNAPSNSKSKHFMKNIRSYNSMFSFTSMGGKIDSSINRGNAPYIFRLSGQNYHSIGSLLPEHGLKPKFSQFGDNQRSTSNSSVLDNDIIQDLKLMLDSNNVLVQSYRMVRDCFHQNPHVDIKLRLIGRRDQDGRIYNLPSASEVAALIVGDIGDSIDNRDIVVQTSSGSLRHISELHPSYLPLQYPLLFPYGDDGYRVDIPHRGITPISNSKRPNCTMREFFSYRIQDRDQYFSLILNSKRCESYEKLRTQQNLGNKDISNIGQRVILPSSFTGGARYMMQNYLDAMSLCKWFGYPDFFITFTCNPKWPQVKRFLHNTSLNPEDRPDILCRLFKIKLDALIKDIQENKIFGIVQGVVYTIEFRKRGLPHCHICLFMHANSKRPTVEYIDPIISAEIPNINEDPELYSLVSEFMIHGPCGAENMNCPCMVDKQCSKKFPKQLCGHSSVDVNGYPLYMRRNNGYFVEKSGVKLDNRNVVPYNKYLLKRYQAHINVEWCNQGSSINYLFKYINKGPDRATIAVDINADSNHEKVVDEIKDYYDCRYISACEASWRIFKYDAHYRYPSVMRLPFHLPDQQQVIYAADDDIDDVLEQPSVVASMFTSWMECNKINKDARKLTYVEFPTKFVWKPDDKLWKPRKIGRSIGRIHSVSPKLGEVYFLRILLNKVKGPKSFEEIRTVNGEEFPTFRDACYALGLLDDDKEYVDAIKEASHSGTGFYLRFLFATMLMSNSLGRPEFVWENTWQHLSDGILYNQQRRLKSPGLSLNEDQLKNLTLFEIEQILLRNNTSLKHYKQMPYPDSDTVSSSTNRLIMEELEYDITLLKKVFDSMFHALTNEQRNIFLDIMTTVNDNKGGVFFVYGYGGTGKTFLWKTLSTAIRCNGDIVLNVASSGIASLLLPGGRTAHSRFIIPLNLTEYSVCKIPPDSELDRLVRKSSLIIWDEAPMVHKHAFEALDRALRDVCKESDCFGGDFKQILPVVQGGSRQNIVNASLSSSYIWQQCKVHRLTKNMRLTVGKDPSDIRKIQNFANWLLDIGEGKVGGLNDGEMIIDVPDDILISDPHDPIGSLIEFVYPSILENFNDTSYFQERAILAPKNEVVQQINDRLLALFPGEEVEYLSSDTLCQSEFVHDQFDPNLYSPDILNGLPNHKLILKVGVPVMLLRNIDQKNGLCNDTRLQVKSLGKRVIEAIIISGTNIGKQTFIPRMSLSSSEKKNSFQISKKTISIGCMFCNDN
uniref:ATP-dependent DNA helicase n=1 Tax=Lactuca sativa TaxID=4236 RepID=A0A9R1XS71_LACSA|nr:hypothetical protein LSAT_V11C300151780 [Lactuca sativa]